MKESSVKQLCQAHPSSSSSPQQPQLCMQGWSPSAGGAGRNWLCFVGKPREALTTHLLPSLLPTSVPIASSAGKKRAFKAPQQPTNDTEVGKHIPAAGPPSASLGFPPAGSGAAPARGCRADGDTIGLVPALVPQPLSSSHPATLQVTHSSPPAVIHPRGWIRHNFFFVFPRKSSKAPTFNQV